MYSVLVSGGGLTGASLAAALADRGMRVAIVEAVAPQSPAQPSLDDRTSAIARTGVRILGNLGVWPLLKEAPSPIHAVEISERGCFGGARIDAAAQGLDSLGSVVRNRVLGEALWDRLRALESTRSDRTAQTRKDQWSEGILPSSRAGSPRSSLTMERGHLALVEGWKPSFPGLSSFPGLPPFPGLPSFPGLSQGSVDIFCPARVTAVSTKNDHVAARLEGNGEAKAHTIKAQLLAVAEGARSPLRDEFGIAAEHKEYPQVAVTGLVEVRKVIRPDIAWERFTAEGPLALLPAGGRRYGFVIVANRGAARIKDMEDAQLLAYLQDLMGYRAGEFVGVGKRATYPLALDRADRVTAPRAVLVGAAANSVHPLAAQGFNLALRDVAALTETLADGGSPPADPGDAGLLSRYAEWRRRDQDNVVRFTDSLAVLSYSAWLRPLRGLGLQAFDLAPLAKPLLARFALGQGGRMPRLARGLRL